MIMMLSKLTDPPNQPEISGYRESMRAGDLERMTCLSVGGNPVADLKWYKGEILLIQYLKQYLRHQYCLNENKLPFPTLLSTAEH